MKIIKDSKKPNVLEIHDDRFYFNEELKQYLPSVTTVLACYPKGYHLTKWIAENGWEGSNRIKNIKGEKGSIVHSAIEYLIEGNDLVFDNFEEDEWRYIQAFANFWEDYKPETIAKEHMITSKEHGYAGTLDWFGSVLQKMSGEERIKIRLDWKTSNNLWVEYDIQLEAYERADVEMGAEPSDERWIVQLGTRTKRGYSIHKTHKQKSETREEKQKDWDRLFDAFRHVKWLWEFQNPNAKPFMKEINKKINIGIKKK